VRRRVRDKPATQHRRSPGSRETGASSGGRGLSVSGPVFGNESVCLIPTCQKFMFDSFVEKVSICKISENPKSAAALVGSEGRADICSGDHNLFVVCPNPDRSLFKYQRPWSYMHVIRLAWQSETSKCSRYRVQSFARECDLYFQYKRECDNWMELVQRAMDQRQQFHPVSERIGRG